MALQLAIKKPSQRQTLLGFLMITAGFLIIGYLTFVKFSISAENQLDPEQFNQALKQNNQASFGQILKADPGLNISASDISSFGSVLGLKQDRLDRANTSVLPEFTISVPKLQIQDARVKTNVNGTIKDTYIPVLKEAIAHFKGTALPGEVGNIFLFGHSMLPILAHGQYESIFTNLPKLQKNDIIKIKYGAKQLTYAIEQTGIVDPQDVFVLQQSQVEQKITLMTCIPPGFGQKRFVAIGKLVSGEYLAN